MNGREVLERIVGPDDYAVLCGAGISVGAGLPAAGAFMENIVKQAGVDDRTAQDLSALLRPDADYPWLRFEGLLQVLKLYWDAKLDVLDAYSGGTVQRIHRHLAAVASRMPVMTTNFDGLIELAAIEDSRPVVGHYSDAEHCASPGLFKLHGTLWRLRDDRRVRVEPSAQDGPVGTLDRVAHIRHSKARRDLVRSVFAQYTVIVLGYSGSDDFDICYWLRELDDVHSVVWLQFHKSALQPSILTAAECGADKRVDYGAVSVADALQRKGLGARFHVVVTNDPPAMVADPLISESAPSSRESWNEQDFARCSFSPVDRHIVTGALYSHVFRLEAASTQFQAALSLGTDRLSQIKSRVGLAEALFYMGAESARRRSTEVAAQAVELARTSGLQEWELRARLFAHLPDALAGHDEARNRLREVFDEAATAQLMDIVALTETWLIRAGRLNSGGADVASNANVLLEQEFAEEHEKIRRNWDNATSPGQLQSVAEGLEQIGRRRLALGAAPGASDSLTQQGVVLMRLADWPSGVDSNPDPDCLTAARKLLERSLDLGRKCDLWRQQYAADVSLLLLSIRFPSGSPDSSACNRLLERYGEVLATDSAEMLRVQIAALLMRLRIEGVAAITSVIHDLDNLCRDRPGRALTKRLQTTARVDARTLEAWQQGIGFRMESVGDLSPLVGTDLTKSPYWLQRLRTLERVDPPRTDDEFRGKLWLLLDPQPPNSPRATQSEEPRT